MSPFSKVEMSPFVVLKLKLQHERYGAGGAPTTNEPTRANQARSNPTSKAEVTQTTASGGAVVSLGAAGETTMPGLPGQWCCGADFQTASGGAVVSLGAAGEKNMPGLPGRWCCGADFKTAWSTFQQSLTEKDNQQSNAVITFTLF